MFRIVNFIMTIIAGGGTGKDSGANAGNAANNAAGTGTTGAGGAAKAQEGLNELNGTTNSPTDLTQNIGFVINMVIGLVGIIAVIVIIIGGINYTMSQGDPGKTKKAKDTILYGIIGLIVSLLAFAIVQFVLNAMSNGN